MYVITIYAIKSKCVMENIEIYIYKYIRVICCIKFVNAVFDKKSSHRVYIDWTLKENTTTEWKVKTINDQKYIERKLRIFYSYNKNCTEFKKLNKRITAKSDCVNVGS